MSNRPPILETDLPAPFNRQMRRGKVRDIYDLSDRLLIVASDRISAFDCVMPQGIPDKGRLLTAISRFWFEGLIAGRCEHHLLGAPMSDEELPDELQPFAEQLVGRTMICRKAEVVPIECVVRGYLAGSGWKEYCQSGTVCGQPVETGLRQCDALPEPIFTPATKATTGHDENIPFERACDIAGEALMKTLRAMSIEIYLAATNLAAPRGILIADTKFEWGLVHDNGQPRPILIDEVLTPDSSRFWPAEQYEPGHDQPSFDKQYLRNWLETLDWDKTPPAPDLPDTVIANTRARYVEAYEKLTGSKFV